MKEKSCQGKYYLGVPITPLGVMCVAALRFREGLERNHMNVR